MSLEGSESLLKSELDHVSLLLQTPHGAPSHSELKAKAFSLTWTCVKVPVTSLPLCWVASLHPFLTVPQTSQVASHLRDFVFVFHLSEKLFSPGLCMAHSSAFTQTSLLWGLPWSPQHFKVSEPHFIFYCPCHYHNIQCIYLVYTLSPLSECEFLLWTGMFVSHLLLCCECLKPYLAHSI